MSVNNADSVLGNGVPVVGAPLYTEGGEASGLPWATSLPGLWQPLQVTVSPA